MKFQDFNLPETLQNTIRRMGFTTPTPIQAEAIPMALEGRDIVATAQTGSGKTAAFGVPLVTHIKSTEKDAAIIVTPTRELAMQVLDVMHELLGHDRKSVGSVLLIGGASMEHQLKQLKRKPRIIVGTPGRINDHLRQRTLKLHNIRFLVLDEADRMMDMGFTPQIDDIVAHLPDDRQTLMFSATMPPKIANMASKYLKNPHRITIGSPRQAPPNIVQEVVKVKESDKYEELKMQLQKREGSIIIFVKTKRGADKLAKRITRDKQKAVAIHGDLRQNQRSRVIRNFRAKKSRVLVATDVVARGLDIPHVEHVINYNLPQCPEDYIHRIGRTARAGAEGEALCLISPNENGIWRDIEQLMDPNKEAPKGGRSYGKKSGSRNGAKRGRGRSKFSSNSSRKNFSKKKRFTNDTGNNNEAGNSNFSAKKFSKHAQKPKAKQKDFDPMSGIGGEYFPDESKGNKKKNNKNKPAFKTKKGTASFKKPTQKPTQKPAWAKKKTNKKTGTKKFNAKSNTKKFAAKKNKKHRNAPDGNAPLKFKAKKSSKKSSGRAAA